MKIYFDGLIYSWQKGGGVHRYFTELMNRLADQADVRLIMPEPNYGAPLKSEVKVSSVFGRPWSVPAWCFKPVRKILSPINKIMFNRYFSKISEGVFYSTYYTSYKSLQIPQVLIVHDLTYERFPELFYQAGCRRFIKQKKKCIDRADAIICISETTKNYLRDVYQVPAEKITLVLHGIQENFNWDYSPVLADGLKKRYNLNKPFLLFVGQRGLYKNFDFLLKALAVWPRHQEFDLVVAGGSPVSAAERELVEKLGLNGQVKFLGYISEEEIKILYCLTKAFIFPSLDEGFGLPNLEAICCGATVLASDLPVFKETAGEIPIYFNPRDIDSLVAALEEMAVRPLKSREEIIRTAERIKELFSWNRCVRETLAVCARTLKSKSRSF